MILQISNLSTRILLIAVKRLMYASDVGNISSTEPLSIDICNRALSQIAVIRVRIVNTELLNASTCRITSNVVTCARKARLASINVRGVNAAIITNTT